MKHRVFGSFQQETNFWQKDDLLWNMLKRQSFHQSTANVWFFLGWYILVFSIFQSHKFISVISYCPSTCQVRFDLQSHPRPHMGKGTFAPTSVIWSSWRHSTSKVWLQRRASASACGKEIWAILQRIYQHVTMWYMCACVKLNPLWTSLSNRTEKSQVTPFVIYEPYVL